VFLIGYLAIFEHFVHLFVDLNNKSTFCHLNIKEFTVSIKKKLLDIVRDKIRFKHYSMSTEKTYVFWIRHYIFFHNKKHPVFSLVVAQINKDRVVSPLDM